MVFAECAGCCRVISTSFYPPTIRTELWLLDTFGSILLCKIDEGSLTQKGHTRLEATRNQLLDLACYTEWRARIKCSKSCMSTLPQIPIAGWTANRSRAMLELDIPTIEKYKTVAKESGEPEQIEKLPGGGSFGWYGPKTASRVLGYIPGGGFLSYASVFQVQAAYDMYKNSRLRYGDDVALAVLSYGKYKNELLSSTSLYQRPCRCCNSAAVSSTAPSNGLFYSTTSRRPCGRKCRSDCAF